MLCCPLLQGHIHGQYQWWMGWQGQKCEFLHFLKSMNSTDQPTNQPTDKASYRVASPRLKTSRIGTIGTWCGPLGVDRDHRDLIWTVGT